MELIIEYQGTTNMYTIKENEKNIINLDYDWKNSWDYSFSIYDNNNKMLLEFDHDDYVYINDDNEPNLLEYIDKEKGIIDILINDYKLTLYTDIVDNKIKKINYFEYNYFLT